MKNKVVAVVICLILKYAFDQRATASKNAYANDINKCLFQYWPSDVLSDPVECSGSQICYNVTDQDPAQFAVCYNTTTRIPEFTAHIVKPGIKSGGRSNWHDEQGAYAPHPQSKVSDYEPASQTDLYPNFSSDKYDDQYCSRGHLTPNADFSVTKECAMTMINTNIAPQWQPFNGGNWAQLEKAVRKYATNQNREVYVFTGTGGQARNNGKVIKLTNSVLAPKYYWKAVCDPGAPAPTSAPITANATSPSPGQSIVFVAKNNIGDIDVNKESGCNGIIQTIKKGVILCYGLQGASQIAYAVDGLKLPPLSIKCNPTVRGTFMDSLLGKLLR